MDYKAARPPQAVDGSGNNHITGDGALSENYAFNTNRMKMKNLIVYYSFSGNNEFLARELQKALKCDIYKIVELKKRKTLTILFDLFFNRKPEIVKPDVDLSRYDHTVLIAPVWNAGIGSPLKSFIEIEKNNLKSYSFITVCSGRAGQHKKLTSQLARLTKTEPVKVTELMINDLLPPEKKDKIKYTTSYRISPEDFRYFENTMKKFIRTITDDLHPEYASRITKSDNKIKAY